MLSQNVKDKVISDSLEKAKILIVDDDESTRKILSLIFTRNKYQVELAVNCQDAIDKAHSHSFDVVIMDIVLPDMEGTDLIASLKEIYPNIILIIITAYPTIETAIRSVNEGASAYFTKPLNMNDVLHTIRSALEKQFAENKKYIVYEANRKELAEHKDSEKSLKHHNEIQQFLFSLSLNFISLSPEDIESGIISALEEIGRFTNTDRCYVCLFSQDRMNLETIHEWCTEGVTRQKRNIEGLHVSNFPWLNDKINHLETIHIPDITKSRLQTDKEKESLRLQDVQSLIVTPIFCNDILLGFFELQSLELDKRIDDSFIFLIKNIASIFANKIIKSHLERISVVVGGDETLFSDYISSAKYNNVELTGFTGDVTKLIELARKDRPDLIIVDFNLPNNKLIDVIKQIKSIAPSTGIILTNRRPQDKSYLSFVIESGAGGYISQNISQQQLIQAIKCVYGGRFTADLDLIKSISWKTSSNIKENIAFNPLSQREMIVLKMANDGMTNKVIAEKLTVSKRTVDSYFRSIFGKLSVNSRIQAINLAVKNNWL